MFGISMWEILLILVVALIILGPRQLAEAAQVMGKLYREIQRMTWDLRNSIDLETLSSSKQDQYQHQTKPETTETTDKVKEMLPGEKSGPDFYADLLESAKEEDEQKKEAQPESKEVNLGGSSPEKKEFKEGNKP